MRILFDCEYIYNKRFARTATRSRWCSIICESSLAQPNLPIFEIVCYLLTFAWSERRCARALPRSIENLRMANESYGVFTFQPTRTENYASCKNCDIVWAFINLQSRLGLGTNQAAKHNVYGYGFMNKCLSNRYGWKLNWTETKISFGCQCTLYNGDAFIIS